MWMAIYIISMVLIFAGGIAMYLMAKDDDDFLIKHAIGLALLTLVLGSIPIVNTIIVLIVAIGLGSEIIKDDNADLWFNKPVNGKVKKKAE